MEYWNDGKEAKKTKLLSFFCTTPLLRFSNTPVLLRRRYGHGPGDEEEESKEKYPDRNCPHSGNL
jgi:hypothetical protein